MFLIYNSSWMVVFISSPTPPLYSLMGRPLPGQGHCVNNGEGLKCSLPPGVQDYFFGLCWDMCNLLVVLDVRSLYKHSDPICLFIVVSADKWSILNKYLWWMNRPCETSRIEASQIMSQVWFSFFLLSVSFIFMNKRPYP